MTDSGMSIRRWLTIGAVLLIVGVAAFARFQDLATNPGGLFPDEAAEALSAHQIATDPGYRPVFIPENGGREPLFAYAVAGAFEVGGALGMPESALLLRATAALFGVLGVIAIYQLGRRFGTGVGLAAGAWAAGSLWLIAVSRDGMRNTIVPAFGAAALLWLIAWYQFPSRRLAAIAGGVTALAALYTYQPLKLLPFLALAWLLWIRRTDRERWQALRPGIPAFVVAFVVVAAPMAVAAIQNPSAWLGRAIGVLPINPDLHVANPLEHVLRTLGMFGITGDPNPRHDVAELPLIGWPLVIVAAVGVVVLWRRRRDGAHLLILLALPLMVVPPLIAPEGGAPHFLRVLGLAAPLGVTIGLGVEQLCTWLTARIRPWFPRDGLAHAVSAALFTAFLAAIALTSITTYLQRPVADRYDAFSFDLVAMAEAIQPGDAVILDDFSALTVEFLRGEPHAVHAQPGIPIPTVGVRRVLARSVADLQAAVGAAAAAGAEPIATDPNGVPKVWALELGG